MSVKKKKKHKKKQQPKQSGSVTEQPVINTAEPSPEQEPLVCPETLPSEPESKPETEISPILAEEEQEQETSVEDREEKEIPPDPALIPAPDVEIPYRENFTADEFTASVNELQAEDIMKNKETDLQSPPKKKRGVVENIVQLALLGIFGVILVVCLVMLGQNVWGKIKGAQIYNNLANQFDIFIPGEEEGVTANTWNPTLSVLTGDTALQTLYDRINSGKTDNNKNEGKYNQQLEQMRASLTALRDVNSDVYGWIYVEGTSINYPILRGTDNDYYLNRAYTGEYLPIGSIFADSATADLITDNYNTVIYGHNVTTGVMFHDVAKFMDADFFANTLIYIYTMDGVFIYQPVSVYQTTSDYYYFRTEFASETSFLAFAEEMVKNSKVSSGATFSSGDTMITLSTCTNGAADGRYSLHAKLIETIN